MEDDGILSTGAPSLSARRAWIEISGPLNAACIWVVALRKESVDRNAMWLHLATVNTTVALRKESVDRNTDFQLFSPP